MNSGLQHVSVPATNQLYLLNQYNCGQHDPWCYHTQFSYHLQIKDLSLPLFHKAIRSVLDRHPVLKTVFMRQDNGEIKQGINPGLKVRVHYEDIRHLISWQQEDWLDQFLLQDRNDPFRVWDQDQPLWRSYIFRRGPGNIQFILVIHHAIWDGWSLAVLLKEIFAHYQALKEKPTLNLAVAPYDYGQFIAEEAERNGAREAKVFWRQHLQNHQPFAPRPIRNKADYNDYRPVERLLSPELATQLLHLQQRLRVTTKSIFTGLFLHMVQDETRQRHTTIGMVTNGRGVHLENPLTTLGLLWNFAPLCVDTNPDHPDYYRQVNSKLAEVAPYGSYPLSAILADQDTSGLFHAAFNFINFEGANLLEAGSGIEFLEVGGLDKFHFPLHLLVGKNPFNKRFSLVLNYDTRYYEANQIEKKLDLYVRRLAQLCNPKWLKQKAI